MTLNITLVSKDRIFQSADYRLTDLANGRTCDFNTQKIFLVCRRSWNATVCFAGIGRSATTDVSEWLAARIDSVQMDDPFSTLLDKIRSADVWLNKIPSPQNRHSFSIGAFLDGEPFYCKLSNWDRVTACTTSDRLEIDEFRPSKPCTFFAGQRIPKSERRELEALLLAGAPTTDVYQMLAEVNANAARRSEAVSPHCFVSHLSALGAGGGAPMPAGRLHLSAPRSPVRSAFHTTDFAELVSSNPPPTSSREALLLRFIRDGMPVQAAFASSEDTEPFHSRQVKAFPNSSVVRSNFGAYLARNGQSDRAGDELRTALLLDPTNVSALTNLAQLHRKKGAPIAAETLLIQALAVDPKFSRAIVAKAEVSAERGDVTGALEILSRAIATAPTDTSMRLCISRLRVASNLENHLSLLDLKELRLGGVSPNEVQALYAVALQRSGAGAHECVAEYRAAIGYDAGQAHLHLNLAQLLFVTGDSTGGAKSLRTATKLGLSDNALLEVQLYRLGHTTDDTRDIINVTKALLKRGATVSWNFDPNIEYLSKTNPSKCDLFKGVLDVMRGTRSAEFLDTVT